MIPALRLVGADRAVKRILEFRNDLRAEQADRQARVVNGAARVTHVAAAVGDIQQARVRTVAFTNLILLDITRSERQRADLDAVDRKSLVSGKSVSVRVELGGSRHIKTNKLNLSP